MRMYAEIARRGFQRSAAYPSATLAGLFTNTMFGFMRGYVLLALFEQGNQQFGGYDRQAAITYVWLTQGLIATVYIWGWHELSRRIRSGDIACDLVRPAHPQDVGLASDLGRAVYHGLFRGVPPVLVGALLFDLIAPGDLLQWAGFAMSVVLAVVISFYFRFLYNLVAFWLLDYRGVVVMAMIAANLFSGFIIPVHFFPEWLATIAYATPFPSMVQTPIDIFVGRLQGAEVATALLHQALWIGVLFTLGRTTFSRGVRKLVVQGG